MALVEINVTSNGGLGRFRRALKGGSPALMRVVGEVLLEHADRCFETETDPWGRPWPKHSDVTLALYAQGGFQARTRARAAPGQRRGRPARPRRRVLTRRYRLARRRLLRGPSGQLRALVPRHDAFSAGVSVSGQARAYAAVQQFGNPDNRLPNRSGGRRAPIPARPFLPLRLAGAVRVDLPADLEAEIVETLRDGLAALAATGGAP